MARRIPAGLRPYPAKPCCNAFINHNSGNTVATSPKVPNGMRYQCVSRLKIIGGNANCVNQYAWSNIDQFYATTNHLIFADH